MKQFRNIIAVLMLTIVACTASAQMVNTTYFLENSPYRHYLNPALEPLSKMYLSLPVLGGTHLSFGTSNLAMSDIIYQHNDKTILFLNPDDPNGVNSLLRRINKSLGVHANVQINLFALGARCKENGYFHLDINERINSDVVLPGGLFQFLFNGGMNELNENGKNEYDLSQLGANVDVYTEFALGYSHVINDHWRFGIKLKFLYGHAHFGWTNTNVKLNASIDEWSLKGNGAMEFAAPLNLNDIDLANLTNINSNTLFPYTNSTGALDIMTMLKPQGFGGAIDFGLVYRPVPMLQVSAAVTDLGLIHWHKGYYYNYQLDATFDGIGEIKYEDMLDSEGNFNSQLLIDTTLATLKGIADNLFQPETGSSSLIGDNESSFSQKLHPNLNCGIDLNFWNNRVGVGVYSTTKFSNKIYEEITVGAAFRPCHWFQIAASYSFMNGRCSNVGAAIGFVTYEGIGLTIAADYVPCTYAAMDINGKTYNVLPYKTQGINLSFGLNFVAGHVRDHDKDGVFDAYDLCADTPRKVKVDKEGCPLDEDGDGVPDYLDECPNTPAEAHGLVDLNGCPMDSDGDGVPDYKDECLNTPYGVAVDSIGCSLDSDHDGVPDYIDLCPNTPEEAYNMVNQDGCPIDTDGDGVPDYQDECPDTEYGIQVDEYGCPLEETNNLPEAEENQEDQSNESNNEQDSTEPDSTELDSTEPDSTEPDSTNELNNN